MARIKRLDSLVRIQQPKAAAIFIFRPRAKGATHEITGACRQLLVSVSDTWQDWADRRIKKHDKDMYEGNGKPGMTTRVSLLEADSVDFREYIEEAKDNQKWIIRLIVGVLIVGVLNLLLRK